MDRLGQVEAAHAQFLAERDWDRFQDPKSLLLALVGEVGELAELFQWLPADQAADLAAEMPLRRNVESKVADVFIYLVSLARTLGIDLAAVAANKIESQRRKYPPETVRGLPVRRSGLLQFRSKQTRREGRRITSWDRPPIGRLRNPSTG